jgi:hypothetical protein
MSRYLPLLSIDVRHAYAAGAPLYLRFVPSAACTALMRREGLLLRHTPHGVELWGDQPALAEVLPLAFQVHTDDPALQFCTAWPVARPLRFVGGDGLHLQPETLSRDAVPGALFAVEIMHRPGAGAAPPQYSIALAARSIHWKYFFSGSLATRALCIVDLDAAASGAGIGFVPSATAAPGTAAYTSAAALPMQRLPQQRLQLREQGAAGKVLIRRLPNASMEKLGKERGRDGLSVAEIYIHQ